MTLQDGGVGFDACGDIGFFTRPLPGLRIDKLSCSMDRTYKCLGSQLWVSLSSEETKKAMVSQP